MTQDDQGLPGGNDGKQGLSGVTQGNPVLPVSLGVSGGEDKISGEDSQGVAPGVGQGETRVSARPAMGLGIEGYRFTPERKAKFLALAKDYWPHIGKLCEAVGISRWTVIHHRKLDPEFNAALHEIDQSVCDSHELMLRTQGLTKGGFLDRMAYLRAHRPELYNPAKVVKIEGYKMTQSERGERLAGLEGAIDAQIVSAYTTRKERLQAQREKRGELPPGDAGVRGE